MSAMLTMCIIFSFSGVIPDALILSKTLLSLSQCSFGVEGNNRHAIFSRIPV